MKFITFLLKIFKIGCIGFGGGSALIPVMEEEFIGEGKLDTKENFDNDVIVATLTPGALPIELASSLGRRNFGHKGMVLGGVMMALPGIILTVALLTILASLQDQIGHIIKCLIVGIAAFIIYLLVHYIKNVFTNCKKISKTFSYRSMVVAIGVFLLSCESNLYKIFGIDATPVFSVSTFHILLTAFFLIFCLKSAKYLWLKIGAVILAGANLLIHGKLEIFHSDVVTYILAFMMVATVIICGFNSVNKLFSVRIPIREILSDLKIWVLFLLITLVPALALNLESLLFAAKGTLSTLMSFGGGDAYLVIADGLFVGDDYITEDIFYSQIVSVVNILPGSILAKTLTALGYVYGTQAVGSVIGGIAFAVAGVGCSVATSCGVFGFIYLLYEEFATSSVFRTFSNYIRPIISGLLGNVMLVLINQSRQTSLSLDIPMWIVLGMLLLLVVVDFLLVQKAKVKPIYLIVLNIACSLCLLFFL